MLKETQQGSLVMKVGRQSDPKWILIPYHITNQLAPFNRQGHFSYSGLSTENFEFLDACDPISHSIFEVGSKESEILIIGSNEPFSKKKNFLHVITTVMKHFSFEFLHNADAPTGIIGQNMQKYYRWREM